MTDALHLAPPVLDWAAQQSGRSLHELATRISTRAAPAIERGELTSAQAMKFARESGVPFGYLFLTEPPAPRARLRTADFRTTPGANPLSKNFFDVYDDIEFKQAWYRDYLLREAAVPLAFVGRFKGKAVNIKAVAADIRSTLGLDDSTARNADDAYGYLVAKVEAAGILVFKNGIVGNNTRRPLSVSEFRGFAISDDLAPVIFINGADTPSAWPFTLMHEVAHIWLGQSGVSDTALHSDNRHEALCNAIAAEVLVPEQDFLKAWSAMVDAPVHKIALLRQQFGVSSLVIARRAQELGLVSRDVYDSLCAEVAHAPRGKKKAQGGDFYLSLAVRNSKTFSRKVAALATGGRISLREAGQLLNTNPNNVVVFHARQHALHS